MGIVAELNAEPQPFGCKQRHLLARCQEAGLVERTLRLDVLGGKLEPLAPASLYPIVIATGPHKRIVAVYEDMVARLARPIPKEVYIVNATAYSELAVELEENFGKCRMEAFDCRGRSVAKDSADLPAGLFAFPVPPSGLLKNQRR